MTFLWLGVRFHVGFGHARILLFGANSCGLHICVFLFVAGARKYGTDYKAIAEVVGNKNESLVRSLFVTYRRLCKLEEVVDEYEKERGIHEISVNRRFFKRNA